MDAIGSSESAPVLIRTYKKEAELEIWKMKADGQYALLKTYPMCRWSGQLGPKTREGDRQVPEGFYTIAPAQMNPNSSYYLSFNVGYPNAYDRALGRTGGNIMVHGVCSSAGCFSMTDAQIAEIYSIAREAFNAGQPAIQMQSFPFHMTAENMAKYRLDPNIAFWKEIKNGADHFEVTKKETPVLVCDRHYVFGAEATGPVSASGPCPALKRDDAVEAQVAEKESADAAEVNRLIASGVKPIETVYIDGGQNAAFSDRHDDNISRPDALAGGGRDIPLDKSGAPATTAVKLAAVDPAAQPSPVPSPSPAAMPYASALAPPTFTLGLPGLSAVTGWLKPADSTASIEPATPVPSAVPLPPTREEAAAGAPAPLNVAALKPLKAKKPADPQETPLPAQ